MWRLTMQRQTDTVEVLAVCRFHGYGLLLVGKGTGSDGEMDGWGMGRGGGEKQLSPLTNIGLKQTVGSFSASNWG